MYKNGNEPENGRKSRVFDLTQAWRGETGD